MSSPPASSPEPAASLRTRVLALGILLLAAGLRFASLGHGLDLRDANRTLLHDHTDARGMVLDVLAALERRDLEPNDFLYRGPGSFLVFGAVDAAVTGALALRHARGWDGVVEELQRNPSLLALLHRWISALAGTLTVLALMRLAWREFGVTAALGAGLVLACSYLHVRESHFGTADALWGLVLVLALDACFRLRTDARPGRYARTGLWIGAAVAMKYFSVVLGLPLLLAHLEARRAARREGRSAPGLPALALAVALVPVGFLAFFPGIFTGSLDSLVEHVFYGADTLAPRWDGRSQLALLALHVRQTFAVGLGESAFLASLAGLVVAWRRGGNGRYLVFSVLGLLPTMFLTLVPVVRYGLGVMIVLAIPAGIALAELQRRTPRLGALLLVVAVAPALVRAVALDLLWRQTDTRVLMVAELRERCARGDEVLAIGLRMEQPYFLEPQVFRYRNHLFAVALERFDTEAVVAAPPRWILWGQPPFEAIPDGARLEQLVRERYREVLRLDNRRAGHVPAGFETVPRAAEIPYARPWTLTRPGPRLVLYERLD